MLVMNYLPLQGFKQKKVFQKDPFSWAPVSHACNPSYSGSRDQEDQGSKLTPGK
jgi:hypothetical protein